MGVERLMANKTKATPQKEEAREKGPETPDAPPPLLDLSDAAVKKMIRGVGAADRARGNRLEASRHV
jgi:hypothetical protein